MVAAAKAEGAQVAAVAMAVAAMVAVTEGVATVVATEERRSPHQHSSAPRAPS